MLKKEDDTVLQPKPGKIDPLVVQAWIDSSINQILGDREFERRGLKVTPALEATGRKNAEKLFRSKAAFDAFPESFQDLVVARQARTAALAASFPQDYQPTEAQLQELFTQVQQSCQDGKLVAQIYVDTQGGGRRDRGRARVGVPTSRELARQRSTDPLGAASVAWPCASERPLRFSVPRRHPGSRQGDAGRRHHGPDQQRWRVRDREEPAARRSRTPVELLAADWHGKHPTALVRLPPGRTPRPDIQVAKRFGTVQRS